MRRLAVLYLLVSLLTPLVFAWGEDLVSEDPFGELHIFKPSTQEPTSLILLISGDGGWEYRVKRMAESASGAGALVVGIDIISYMGKEKTRNWEGCPFEDLLKLSSTIQEKLGFKGKYRPTLIGYSSGATVAYAALAEDPTAFAGAITLGFCPDLHGMKICAGDQLKWHHASKEGVILLQPDPQLGSRWIALQGEIDKECNAEKIAPYVKKIPGAELVSLKGVGHGFNVPDAWIAAFLEALQKLQNH